MTAQISPLKLFIESGRLVVRFYEGPTVNHIGIRLLDHDLEHLAEEIQEEIARRKSEDKHMNRVKEYALRKNTHPIITVVNWWENGQVTQNQILPNGNTTPQEPLPSTTAWNDRDFLALNINNWDETN